MDKTIVLLVCLFVCRSGKVRVYRGFKLNDVSYCTKTFNMEMRIQTENGMDVNE
jgi:hypothetical protein